MSGFCAQTAPGFRILRARRAVDGRDWGCDSERARGALRPVASGRAIRQSHDSSRARICGDRGAGGGVGNRRDDRRLYGGGLCAGASPAVSAFRAAGPYVGGATGLSADGVVAAELSRLEGDGDVVRSDGGVCSVVYFDGRARRTDSGGRRQPRGGFATYARHCACHGPMVYCRRGTQRRARSRDSWLRIVAVSIRRPDGRDRRKDSAGRRRAHDHRRHAARVFVPAAQRTGLAALTLRSRGPGESQQ